MYYNDVENIKRVLKMGQIYRNGLSEVKYNKEKDSYILSTFTGDTTIQQEITLFQLDQMLRSQTIK